jgi:hypothetical protein
MPVTTASEKIGSRIFLKSYDHDPGAATAVIASPDGGTTLRTLDMRDYDAFGVMARPTIVGGTGLVKLEIIASASSAMTTETVIKDSGAVAGDSLNDVVWLECTSEEVAQAATDAGVALRYVAARLTMGTNTDEANVSYVGFPTRRIPGMTATAIT